MEGSHIKSSIKFNSRTEPDVASKMDFFKNSLVLLCRCPANLHHRYKHKEKMRSSLWSTKKVGGRVRKVGKALDSVRIDIVSILEIVSFKPLFPQTTTKSHFKWPICLTIFSYLSNYQLKLSQN